MKQEYIYVHNVHLVKVDERLNAMAEELSKRTGLPIVHNRADYSFTNECGKFLDGGPEEFIGWIANARYVLANSFHATVFSMIYHKEFITIPHFQNPDRMRFFLNSLGIGKHLLALPEELPADLSRLAIDYNAVEEKRKKMRERSIAFLKYALDGQGKSLKERGRSTYFDFTDPYKCYGCRACEQICSTGAIEMKADEQGFIYPKIINSKCIYCDDCKKVCIYDHPSLFHNEKDSTGIKVYAAYNEDEETKTGCAAGGVFPALCAEAMKEKGAVAGVAMDENQDAVYTLADNEEGCKAFRDVKYVAANNETIKPKVRKLLEEGRLVVYSGTPCEIAGLRAYLLKDYENLITVDVMCSGMAAPAVYKDYKNALVEKYRSRIESIQFDNKFRGKKKGYFIVTFDTGEIHLEETRKNSYMNNYKNRNLQRPACYTCEFMQGTKSVSDITLGRFKGASIYCEEMDDMYGTSFVQVNTAKGLAFFEKAKENLVVRECDKENLPDYFEKSPIKLMMARSKLTEKYNEEDDVMAALDAFNTTKKRRRKRR